MHRTRRVSDPHICDHGLGPVNPGDHDKCQLVITEIKDIPFLNLMDIVLRKRVVTLHYLIGLAVGHNLDPGISAQDLTYHAGVIGLHVVDDHIFQIPSSQRAVNMRQIVGVRTVLNRIYQGRMLVGYDI